MGYQPPEHPDPAAALLEEYRRHTEGVRTLYDAFLGNIQPQGEEPTAEGADPVALFFSADLPVEQLRGRLTRVGFEDLERALRNFQALREGQPYAHYPPQTRRTLARIAPLLVEELAAVPDPDLALTNFERFLTLVAQRTTLVSLLADRPGALALLVRLFGTSEFLSATLLHHPDLLDVLLAPEPFTLQGGGRLREDLARAIRDAPPGSARLDALRRVKKAEELRIGLQDVLSQVDVSATNAALTHLAEACLQAALGMAEEDLAARFGRADPPGFSILAMGKLGGMELGYASDLDLVFVYRADGTSSGPERLSHVEYFSKLGDRVAKILTSITQEGHAYRVDTRLRPGGGKGEMAVSLAGLDAHFSRMAELWERQAYIKARPVAGDPEVGAAAVARAHAFVYDGPAEPELRERIHGMRTRLEVERGGGRGAQVKVGAGGIVDIEFLVQYLQLRHGGENRALRTPNTLEALRQAAGHGLLEAAAAAALADSYRFLRRVENRLRIVADLSVSTLPASPLKLEKLAKRMGYRAEGDRPGREAFLGDYAVHTGRVRAIYNTMLGGGQGGAPGG
jgi:glutamate-ammonia-ligase adenylyltransferase